MDLRSTSNPISDLRRSSTQGSMADHLVERAARIATWDHWIDMPMVSWREDFAAAHFKKTKDQCPPWHLVSRRITVDMHTSELIEVSYPKDPGYSRDRIRGLVPEGPRDICTYFWVERGRDLGHTCPSCKQWVRREDRILHPVQGWTCFECDYGVGWEVVEEMGEEVVEEMGEEVD